MTNAFTNAIVTDMNEAEARTANGMKSRATTASKVLDFFSKVGSARGNDFSGPFMAALADNEDLAIRALLWTRDVRGGAGERGQFRNLIAKLETHNPNLAGKLVSRVPELGRWDDLFAFQNPLNRNKAFALIAVALSERNGLCAKWMPRKGPNAVELRKYLKLSPKSYRKLLVLLTNVVESKMCAKDWNNINFSHVPSLAAARYQAAFRRNAPEAFAEYKTELSKPVEDRDPNVKVNAGAVYPYNVIKSLHRGDEVVADAQWDALPNYVGNALSIPIVDVSGSMGWGSAGSNLTPLDVAVSLGLYLSEKNMGPFKDTFMTFSSSADFVHLKGTLSQRMKQMNHSEWGYSTNLHSAFERILNVAVMHKVPASEMPQTILILSDMQFNSCVDHDDSAIQMIARKYSKAGYVMPKVVFWNLNANFGDDQPVRFDKNGTALVSGFSPAIAKAVLANDLEDFTPMNVMIQTLMDPRYDY